MNRHYRRTIKARQRRKIKKGRTIKLTKINLRVFEKQKAITELQYNYLRQRLALVEKGSKIAIRITKILTKVHMKSLRELHSETIKKINEQRALRNKTTKEYVDEAKKKFIKEKK